MMIEGSGSESGSRSIPLTNGSGSGLKNVQVTEEAFSSQKRHFKAWTFTFFFTFVGHFCPPGSTDPIESGSNPDPDPQPWFYVNAIGSNFFMYLFKNKLWQFSILRNLWLQKKEIQIFYSYSFFVVVGSGIRDSSRWIKIRIRDPG